MTGRELIIYILENHLEDEVVLTDSGSPLFMTVEETAVKWETGRATVKALAEMGKIKSIKLGENYYILAAEPNPFSKQ